MNYTRKELILKPISLFNKNLIHSKHEQRLHESVINVENCTIYLKLKEASID